MDFRDVLEYGEPIGSLDEAKTCFNIDLYFYACYPVGLDMHVKRLSKTFKREPRYVVFKLADLDCLNESEKQNLNFLIAKVAKHRKVKGKSKLDGVFIENDWRCHNEAWALVAKEYNTDQEAKLNLNNPQL